MYSHFKVDISTDIAELHEKMMTVKLLIIVIIVFNYPSTYCLMQGRYFISSKFETLEK